MLFAGAFPAMYSTFVKYEFQHTYDAILAAPVDVEELVTGEALWIAARVGVYGTVPILVGIIFGLDPSWGMLLVPPIAALSAYGWAVVRDLHRRQGRQDRELLVLAERPPDARCSWSRARSSRSAGSRSGPRCSAT